MSFDAVEHPSNIEMVITSLPTGADGTQELWKLNHYYERLDEWNADHGIAPNPFASPAAEPVFELHNLSADPQERHNRAGDERPCSVNSSRCSPPRGMCKAWSRGCATPSPPPRWHLPFVGGFGWDGPSELSRKL